MTLPDWDFLATVIFVSKLDQTGSGLSGSADPSIACSDMSLECHCCGQVGRDQGLGICISVTEKDLQN